MLIFAAMLLSAAAHSQDVQTSETFAGTVERPVALHYLLAPPEGYDGFVQLLPPSRGRRVLVASERAKEPTLRALDHARRPLPDTSGLLLHAAAIDGR